MRKRLLFAALAALVLMQAVGWAKNLSPQARILTTGLFHGNEVSVQNGERWWAVFKEPETDSYFARPVTLDVKAVEDPIVGEPGNTSGREIRIRGVSEQHQPPLFLVSGVGGLMEGTVATYFEGPQFVAPGQVLAFDLGDRHYRLSAYGTATREGTVDGYALRLAEMRDGSREASQVIHEDASLSWGQMEANVPHLLWVGDLNRDGRLDLLLDATNHYNVSDLILFLSPGHTEDRLVEPAARFTTMGC